MKLSEGGDGKMQTSKVMVTNEHQTLSYFTQSMFSYHYGDLNWKQIEENLWFLILSTSSKLQISHDDLKTRI